MSESPIYLYRIVPVMNPPPSAPSAFDLSDDILESTTEREHSSGYLLLWPSTMVLPALTNFYDETPSAYTLCIKYGVVENRIKWEDEQAMTEASPGEDGMIPHFHVSEMELSRDMVDKVEVLMKEDGRWEDPIY